MITKEELNNLLTDIESDRVERTTSATDTNKFCEAICSFSNDLPDHKLPGYLIIGVNNDGTLTGLRATDQLLQNLASLRSDGNIRPIPTINVDKFNYPDGEVAVVEVIPSNMPPVRYNQKVCIRVGPRRGIASEMEERILTEKRISKAKSYDLEPCFGSNIEDINLELFKLSYLPLAVEKRIIDENNRDIKEQLSSLRFYDLQEDCPTNAGIIIFGNNPLLYFPGAYIQFVRFSGDELSSDVKEEKKFSGELITMINILDEFLNIVIESRPIFKSNLREEIIYNYPFVAIREFLMNSILHRDYQSNGPVQFYLFESFIQIQNPGGLFGNARPENFPKVNDYRNPVLAEALKTLGYVNKFSRGVITAKELLKRNDNPEPEIIYDQPSYLSVSIKKRAI